MPKPATTRIGAYGIILRPQQILLCRISGRVKEHAGLWTMPGGGIEFGEDPTDAMLREVREETGLDVRAAGVAGVDSLLVQDAEFDKHSLRILYFTEVIAGDLVNEADGSTDLCAWQDIDRVPSLPTVGLVETALALL